MSAGWNSLSLFFQSSRQQLSLYKLHVIVTLRPAMQVLVDSREGNR